MVTDITGIRSRGAGGLQPPCTKWQSHTPLLIGVQGPPVDMAKSLENIAVSS